MKKMKCGHDWVFTHMHGQPSIIMVAVAKKGVKPLYTLKSISSYLSAVLYKFFTLASRPKISIHCFTGDSGAQVHDFSQCFLCLLLPFLIFPAIVCTRLIRRRRKRREALSLRERSRELRFIH
ncbi:unnamed protein product, partial [Vitis vinifera]